MVYSNDDYNFCLLQIFWSHNGVQLEEDELHSVEIVEDENTYKCTLSIQEVTPQDAGTYKCVAINEAGEETVSASLIVKEAPVQKDLRGKLKTEV